jgi:diadenosine tetraphosphate (Ap4A) HIT family hydrolase|tara:strand:- start:760 stop:1128 length:369 start_codon:yes stop_codon:yes gene_type:complete
MSNPFKNLPEDKKIHVGKHFFIIEDNYPVSPGHLLIISNKEKTDYFELSEVEQKELTHLICVSKIIIEQKYKPDGYNIGMNCGESAGQTVFHFHCHIIPRYLGDMDNPRGGVRHCVKGKGNY